MAKVDKVLYEVEVKSYLISYGSPMQYSLFIAAGIRSQISIADSLDGMTDMCRVSLRAPFRVLTHIKHAQ